MKKTVPTDLLNRIYTKKENLYCLQQDIDEKDKSQINNELKKLSTLFIIDFGEGMTNGIIQKHWMTIGTDHKANNIFTKTGRVRSGAKGIGRFALDKLGDKCTMITKIDPSVHSSANPSVEGYIWSVDWRDFEGEFKTIDKVQAELTEFNELNLNVEIEKRIKNKSILDLIKKNPFRAWNPYLKYLI